MSVNSSVIEVVYRSFPVKSAQRLVRIAEKPDQCRSLAGLPLILIEYMTGVSTNNWLTVKVCALAILLEFPDLLRESHGYGERISIPRIAGSRYSQLQQEVLASAKTP